MTQKNISLEAKYKKLKSRLSLMTIVALFATGLATYTCYKIHSFKNSFETGVLTTRHVKSDYLSVEEVILVGDPDVGFTEIRGGKVPKVELSSGNSNINLGVSRGSGTFQMKTKTDSGCSRIDCYITENGILQSMDYYNSDGTLSGINTICNTNRTMISISGTDDGTLFLDPGLTKDTAQKIK